MTICGKCGAEVSRIRTTFRTVNGQYIGQTDECPQCAPGSFEPQWMREKLVPAYEAYPERYQRVHREDGGIGYVATEEQRADEEAKILRPCSDDVEAKQKAIQRRREWAKTRPTKLTTAQIEAINSRRSQLLNSYRARVAGVRVPE